MASGGGEILPSPPFFLSRSSGISAKFLAGASWPDFVQGPRGGTSSSGDLHQEMEEWCLIILLRSLAVGRSVATQVWDILPRLFTNRQFLQLAVGPRISSTMTVSCSITPSIFSWDGWGCNSRAETVVGFLSSGSASWMKPRVLKEIPDSPSLYPARLLEDPSSTR